MTSIYVAEARARALARARRVRSRRAEIKALLAVGELDVREVVADPPLILRGARVVDILTAAPWLCRIRAERLLREVGITNPRVEFGWLKPERRRALAAAIPAHKPTRGSKRQRRLAEATRACRYCGEEFARGGGRVSVCIGCARRERAAA